MDKCVREALLWEAEGEGAPGGGLPRVRCFLCSHHCLIADGKRGICGVRENRGGRLHTLVYGRLVSESLDPIEKKPLFHFHPGSVSHSIATVGCNFRCAHCQNYGISQVDLRGGEPAGGYVPPERTVSSAAAAGAKSISYTYTEPTIFFEYARDVMELAHGRGIANVFVTNGFMTGRMLDLCGGLLDAANVDLKAMSEEFYRRICGAHLAPVLENIAEMVRRGIWVEVTTLVIPGHNDSEKELREIARFLAGITPDLPWHVSGFFPTYKLTDAPPTPAETLTRARRWGLEEGLRYVYTGNRPAAGGEDTSCPECGERVIGRRGFAVTHYRLDPGGKCSRCGTRIAGIFGEIAP